MESLLSKARKLAEQAEVFRVSSRETPVHFEANRLKQVQTKESDSVALRIFRGGRIGFSTASSLDDRETLLRMALETSQFGPPAKFQLPSLKDYSEVSIFDPQVEKIALEELVELGNKLIAKVRAHTPEVLCDVELTKGTSSVHIINSQGGEASYDKSFFGLGLEGILIRDTDMLFVGDSESSCRLLSNVDAILADRIIKQLEMAKEEATVPNKPLPVIFTPQGVASALLSPIALAFNGKTIFEGASPLKDKLGGQIFDKSLSLWDDATIAYGVESCPCDDEGVPSQRLPLIADGIISNFLYDLQTAALAGARSTGSGRRLGSASPRPAISSLIVNGGTLSFKSMLEDMKEGLVVEQLIGAEQSNLLGGDFSGNVLLGYKVENGEIVGRVKDTMIAGNIYEVLKELLGVGHEVRWVNGTLQTPALYCSGISVTAKGS